MGQACNCYMLILPQQEMVIVDSAENEDITLMHAKI